MKNLKVEYVSPDTLSAFAGNARTHSEKQVGQIAESIRKFGFVNPILVDDAGGVIAGHGRLMAAGLLAMDMVPVIRITHLSERERRALVLADNKIALNAGWDLSKLSDELSALVEMDFNLELTGFDEHEIDALLRDDAGVLPTNWHQDMIPQVPEPRAAQPTANNSHVPVADEPPTPKASDDAYSRFDLVMLHENKLALVEALNDIREEFQYEKLEDCLLHMVRFWRDKA
jgi:hypothetical protein